MKNTTTVIIGAGQSGLAMSRELTERNIDHLILERGDVANSWRRERWESLRLLTPNWMNGMPGAPYRGDDQEGFMPAADFADDLENFAKVNSAPIMKNTTVMDVSRCGNGFIVQTDQAAVQCESVVVATGATSRASRPFFGDQVPGDIATFSPLEYKRPDDLPDGKVLVVGASASGTQIAREINLAGRDVTLSVGEHVRVPRRYRDADVLTWMEITGRWNTRYDEVDDLNRQRGVPSMQLTGETGNNSIELNALQDIGIEIVGRMAGIDGGKAYYSGSLANACASADLKMNRLLNWFDEWARDKGLDPLIEPSQRFPATRTPKDPRLTIDLRREGFKAIVWATGYKPDHSWINLPVFDRKGRIVHDGGFVTSGLYVMGLPFLLRRKSTFIDGVGDDAREIADHMVANLNRRLAA